MQNPALSLRSSDPAAALVALGAGLSITGGPRRAEPPPAASAFSPERGTATLGAVAGGALAARATSAVRALRAAGLPAVFVYAFDELWTLGDRVRAAVARSVGADYLLVEDVWAWEIPPGQAGWPAHRGWSSRLDREAPELVNTWVALSDAPVERSCMWLVALEDDASYPGALARTDDTCSAARPAPLAAGEALAWNANVLHWGGPCSAAAKGPRTSCSFSLVRADAVDRLPFPPVSLEGLDLERRLDVVAAQIEVYGEGQPDVTREARAWAAARRALAAASDASSSLRDSFPSR